MLELLKIYTLCCLSFLLCCSPVLHSEKDISFIEGKLVTRRGQSKESIWGIIKVLFLEFRLVTCICSVCENSSSIILLICTLISIKNCFKK